jgi:hypothetical protein
MAADYAQVSTDGGDQFHLLGTPPRGQQALGGGGDCASRRVTKNPLGNYQYAYAGLGALSGFTTSTSPNNGHSLATAGADANGGITSNGVLADRQWMTFTNDHNVLLSWNQQEPRNVVVQTSTDGGLTYSPISSIAAPDPEFPGRCATSRRPTSPTCRGRKASRSTSPCRTTAADVDRLQGRLGCDGDRGPRVRGR